MPAVRATCAPRQWKENGCIEAVAGLSDRAARALEELTWTKAERVEVKAEVKQVTAEVEQAQAKAAFSQRSEYSWKSLKVDLMYGPYVVGSYLHGFAAETVAGMQSMGESYAASMKNGIDTRSAAGVRSRGAACQGGGSGEGSDATALTVPIVLW